MSFTELYTVSETLTTIRLLLEPFSEKYLTREYVDWLNKAEVVRYSEQRRHKHTIASCRKYIESFKDSPNHIWAISVVNSDLGHIGNISAHVDLNNKIADIGILIGKPEVWGNGYGAEAWRSVCDYLFNVLNLRKVTAGALSINKRILRLMRKVGMVEDGRRVRHYICEGKEVDIIHTAIFREDYLQRRTEK
jgi:RimJ/RimL family protein N-acetyltransferase